MLINTFNDLYDKLDVSHASANTFSDVTVYKNGNGDSSNNTNRGLTTAHK